MKRAFLYSAFVAATLGLNGCGGGGGVQPPPAGTEAAESQNYAEAMSGMGATAFQNFIKNLPTPEKKVEYLKKSAEDPMQAYQQKETYERAAKDANPAVAAAAKECLAKVPTQEEYSKLRSAKMEEGIKAASGQ